MKNEYGLDVSYFKKKLELVLRDISRYTPDEFAREMARLSVTADETVMREPEFSSKANAEVEQLNTDVLAVMKRIHDIADSAPQGSQQQRSHLLYDVREAARGILARVGA